MANLTPRLLLALSWSIWFAMAQPQPPVVIDGQLNDALWETVRPQRLAPAEAGVPAGTGGEIRATIVGRYLCVAARLPEPPAVSWPAPSAEPTLGRGGRSPDRRWRLP
jgi:hypothetical protein